MDNSTVNKSIHHRLKQHAEKIPAAPAILGVSGERFDYGALWETIARVAGVLQQRGITAQDCLAMVVPEGPATTLSFLAISAVAKCAPLNPGYSERDFQFYLDDLKPKALLIPLDHETAAIKVAEAAGVPVWRIVPPSADAPSRFAMEGDSTGETWSALPDPADTALILHTSGTTSRPKMVPLSHANLFTSAANITRTLSLTSADRALNVMPLFHIHGIVGGLLSSLYAGASIVCGPGFQGDKFFDWAKDNDVNWYSAVPTIHQAVLQQAKENSDAAASLKFRLIRSSSSPLPPAVFHEMEERWNAPVIESYGMTEAAHQMASNLLPPGQRKPGSVGVPAGPEITIRNEAGEALEQGATGEICIRGANVTSGYVANPEANAGAFMDGWFRTGDQGRFDEDGYLFLTGRLKEMINRGGENIAPKEIDEVLTEHEAVIQAVAFAVPHPTLGEDLAAAVVLAGGAKVTELTLRDFIAARLAGFKVPSRIVFVESIPKGPTGKLQRIGLYEKLKTSFETEYQEPVDEEERAIAEAYSTILGIEKIGRGDNFFYLGGDSLKAQRVIAQMADRFDLEIPPGTLFRYPTPELLGVELRRLREAEAELEDLAGELKDLSPEELARLLDEAEEKQ